MRIIGITGPSGAGKSLLREHLADIGISVIDADAVYHGLLVPPSECLDALRVSFGDGVLCQDGTLDRRALGKIVFNDKDKLELLNKTVLGYVLDEFRRIIDRLEASGKTCVAIDAPTLIESGFDKECHTVIAVLCPPELRVKRIMARDGISEEAAQTRTNAQKPDEFYIERADIVLNNNGDEEKFSEDIRRVAKDLVL